MGQPEWNVGYGDRRTTRGKIVSPKHVTIRIGVLTWQVYARPPRGTTHTGPGVEDHGVITQRGNWGASPSAGGPPTHCSHCVLAPALPAPTRLAPGPLGVRDNFGSRMSLGRLSPQGAMMMFEAPYIGVSVPRGVPGRGTAVDDDDVPVEVQGFWTPDPRRAEKKGVVEDLAILDRLRPATSRHPKLQVQLAEELLHPIDEDDKSVNIGEWQAVLCADLVPALSFDDHNPNPLASAGADRARCADISLRRRR